MKFCQKCGSLYFLKKQDDDTLSYHCRTCGNLEPRESSDNCIYQSDIDKKASSYYNVKGSGNAVASHKKALADAIKKHKGKAKEKTPLYHVVSGGPHGTYHVRTDQDGKKIITHVVFNENNYDKSGKKRTNELSDVDEIFGFGNKRSDVSKNNQQQLKKIRQKKQKDRETNAPQNRRDNDKYSSQLGQIRKKEGYN